MKTALVIVVGCALVVGVAVVALFAGVHSVPISALWGEGSDVQIAVLWELRLPRICVAFLDGAGLAACVSALVYSARREDAPAPRIPAGATAAALTETLRIWSALEDRERDHRLEVTPEPDPGLARAVHLWARGRRLEEVLEDGDLAAGDFVRWCKQVVDLLGQVQQAVGDDEGSAPLRRTSRDAVERVRRGIVAYSSVS